MTFCEIEARVRAVMDGLDRMLLNGDLPRPEYDVEAANIETWALAEYERYVLSLEAIEKCQLGSS